jgi:transposase InsO family protein
LPYIKATWKGRAPFRLWALDLVTRLLPPGKNGETTLGVAVCPFSKWIEAQPLPDKSSHTIMQWFHFRIVCQFGVPWGVRVDQGTEFKGRFQEYCEYLGIKILTIYTAHPQANGLVERYNGVIRAGLRKSATFKPDVPWTELLPAILAGLRFLPTRLGYPPAWIAFK